MRSLVRHLVFCCGLLLVLIGFRWWIAAVPETPTIVPPEATAQEWRLFLEYLRRPKTFAGEIGLHPLGFAAVLAAGTLLWLRHRSRDSLANVPHPPREEFCNQS